MTCATLRISVPLSRSGLRGTRSGFITVRALDRRASGDSPRGVRPELVILQHLHHGARVSFSLITLSRVHLRCVAPYDWAGRSVKTTAAELEMSLYSALHLEPGISILPGEKVCSLASGSSKLRTVIVSTAARFRNILCCV